jgi:hypothetical protein
MDEELKRMIDCCKTSNPEFKKLWVNACTKTHDDKIAWIEKLRAEGIKAAHPDDGWVNRENNSVFFMYPQFDDGIKDGELLALGWPDKYRVVKSIEVKREKGRLSGEIEVGVKFKEKGGDI